MASVKMLQWEKEFLRHTKELKDLVHKHVTEDKHGVETGDIKQEFLTLINDMFTCGHEKVRKQNKALAYLHRTLDEHGIKTSAPTSKFTMGDQVNGEEK